MPHRFASSPGENASPGSGIDAGGHLLKPPLPAEADRLRADRRLHNHDPQKTQQQLLNEQLVGKRVPLRREEPSGT
ncbi:MAG: hypothetical protein L6W00_11065 [Lentisphaeria bacterium]|nr:MAG: hypothetical protein L6W00_11065 [Lentisphaeria bacterium]